MVPTAMPTTSPSDRPVSTTHMHRHLVDRPRVGATVGVEKVRSRCGLVARPIWQPGVRPVGKWPCSPAGTMPRTVLDAVGYPAPATWKPEPCLTWTPSRGPTPRGRNASTAAASTDSPNSSPGPTSTCRSTCMPTTGVRGVDHPASVPVGATTPDTPVWDLARSITWSWFRPMFPIEHVPLPPTVRREGDPGRAWDQHAYLLGMTGKRLGDDPARQLRFPHQDVGSGRLDGRLQRLRPRLSCWDLAKPWDAPGQPKGRRRQDPLTCRTSFGPTNWPR